MILWYWRIIIASLFYCCLIEVEPAERKPLRKPRKVFHTTRKYRQPKSVGTFKAIDLSEESDQEEDENGEYTSAFIKKEDLPNSFTICSAFSVDAWTTEFSQSAMFALLSEDSHYWAFFELYASDKHTEYWAKVGEVMLNVKDDIKFFPLTWSRACFALDLDQNRMWVVVNGKLLGEQSFSPNQVEEKPENLNILMGFDDEECENTGKTTNLNVFSSVLSVARMERMTEAGGEECGLDIGDFLTWSEALALVTLRSKARIVEIDAIEGACRKGSQVQVFTASFDQHHWCMQHCQKLGGRSPPVTTLEEWETMVRELEAISSETFYDYMWTSATEGDKDGSSARLSHWPQLEVAYLGIFVFAYFCL